MVEKIMTGSMAIMTILCVVIVGFAAWIESFPFSLFFLVMLIPASGSAIVWCCEAHAEWFPTRRGKRR